MRLVVDSNVVFAGLLRDGTTRALLIHPPFALLAPEWMLVEVRRYRGEIAARSGLTSADVELLMGLLTAGVDVVPHEAYEDRMEEAEGRIGARDPGDVPFLALALAERCDGIWTQNTTHFEGAGVELWSTKRVLAFTRSGTRG